MPLLLPPQSEKALWSTKMPLNVVQKQFLHERTRECHHFHRKIQKRYKTLSLTQNLQSCWDSRVFIWWFCWCCCIQLPHMSSGPSLLLSVHLLRVSVARPWTWSQRSLGCVSGTRFCMENKNKSLLTESLPQYMTKKHGITMVHVKTAWQ